MKFQNSNVYLPIAEKIYFEIRKKLLTSFPDCQIEHVGSSSVPGLLSKGDVDIFLGVPEKKHEKIVKALIGMGYKVKVNTHRDKDLCMFEVEGLPLDVAIQVVSLGSNYVRNFLGVRDMLRNSSSLRDEYNQLKKDSEGKSEVEYRKAKEAFVARLLSLQTRLD